MKSCMTWDFRPWVACASFMYVCEDLRNHPVKEQRIVDAKFELVSLFVAFDSASPLLLDSCSRRFELHKANKQPTAVLLGVPCYDLATVPGAATALVARRYKLASPSCTVGTDTTPSFEENHPFSSDWHIVLLKPKDVLDSKP